MSQENQNEPEDEQVIQEIKPSWKAYIGWVVIGLVTIPASGLGIAILVIVFLKLKSDSYKITNERIIIKRGIISRKLEEIELFRIKDIGSRQGILERLLNVGTVEIISVDSTTPKLLIKGINQPVELKEKLRKLFKSSRKKERVVNTELMFSN